ncbi:hypothetical protein BGZ49_008852 [Haplosporangium sp. Z 27]|nr:hypothetical protein BGZ49_008852 [Haplosporangium sp. Z 27]
MAAVPTLPFVVVKAHKPYSASDILDTATTTTSPPTTLTAITAAQSSNFSNLQGQTVQANNPSLPTATGSSSSISPNTSRTGSMNQIVSTQRHNSDSSTPRDSAPQLPQTYPPSIHTRTIHPQVHYIFEDDPLESEILESIPKSRCITLDLDPRSGTIKNVESFLTNLQVMDIKLVPFQDALTTSSTSSLNSMANNATVQINESDIAAGGGNQNTGLTKVNSSGPSSLQLSMATSTSRTGGRLSEKGPANQSGGGESDIQKSVKNDERSPTVLNSAGPPKDWTLIIDAMEIEDKDQDR